MRILYSTLSNDKLYKIDVSNKKNLKGIELINNNEQKVTHASSLSDISVNAPDVHKNNYIQKILTIRYNESTRLLCITKKDGSIKICRYISNEDLYSEVFTLNRTTKDQKDYIINLYYKDSILYCCSNKGRLMLTNLKNLDTRDFTPNPFIIQLSEPLNFFKVHPINQWIIACGGYSNNLQLYNLETPFNGFNSSLHLFNYSSINKISPFWSAKTVQRISKKHLEEFTWIVDCEFIVNNAEEKNDCNLEVGEGEGEGAAARVETEVPEEKYYKMCSVTGFGKLYYYDTEFSSYPTLDLTVSNHPIKLLKNLNDYEFLFIDAFGYCGLLDIVKEKITNSYRLPNMGSICGIDIINWSNYCQDFYEKNRVEKNKNDDYDDELKKLELQPILITYSTILGEVKTVRLFKNNSEDHEKLKMQLISSIKLQLMDNSNYRRRLLIPCLIYDFCNQEPSDELSDLNFVFYDRALLKSNKKVGKIDDNDNNENGNGDLLSPRTGLLETNNGNDNVDGNSRDTKRLKV
ncbi:hypothetical protein PACTADRAFT_50709 [Pachysolen tannophilus NRRL Y-2460]|uniref:Ribosome biogenesis protein NSA1 n=1 Tax=Pachysolen tannophilus NRRL Y-2460 TaxID=669874 RepID=A0A1E4TSZ5_PACTA|nr:hypothetical protein PACTADRAFT_50709 [Pachysolen tannophilus NRRL Y-2460]